MTWLFIAIIAQIILGTSAVFDKLLLKRQFFDPWVYTFWIGIFGGFISLFLMPFGFLELSIQSRIVALVTGVIFIGGLFFLFTALQRGYASTTFTLVGALTPLATLIIGSAFFRYQLWGVDLLAFSLLVLGGLLFFSAGRKRFYFSGMIFIFASIAFFGLYTVLTKLVFEQNSFIAGFIWIKWGAAMAVVLCLAVPALRKRVFALSHESSGWYRVEYIANMIYAGIGSILVNFAISLAHPALVDATQSFKYVVIFIVAWFLLRERFFGRQLVIKIIATALIIFGLVWLGLAYYARSIPVDSMRAIAWSVTFSSKFSKELGLDWRKNLEGILYEVQPRKIRLIAYWDEIEKRRGEYAFGDLDWEMNEAARAQVPIVLTVGMRVPRWPECHIPAWAAELGVEEREAALRAYLGVLIERYRNHSALAYWQLENEPFLRFGECPSRGEDFFEQELTLLKSIDSSRPVIVTDSGEFGAWYRAVREGDIFGTTMYRRVYPPSVGRFTGIIDYPIGASYFRLRERVARFLAGEYKKLFVVIELQAEPWAKKHLGELSYEEQMRIFPLEYFAETIQFARETGFSEYYLWGAEWWYLLREKGGDSHYWDMVIHLVREDAEL